MFKKILTILMMPVASVYAAESLEQSANQYCELYNPAAWEKGISEESIQSIYSYIIQHQEVIDFPSSMKAVINSADNSSFGTYFYSIHNGMNNLLGKSWECKYFDDFYLPEQKIIPLSLGNVSQKRIDPNASNTIVIMLASDGTLLINNAPLRSAAKFKQALTSTIHKHSLDDLTFVLYLDSGADGGKVAGLFSQMISVGIKDVQLIEY